MVLDIAELVNADIDLEMPLSEKRIIACDKVLAMLATLKGKDLEPHLSKFEIDKGAWESVIELRFPVGSHKPKPFRRDGKPNRD